MISMGLAMDKPIKDASQETDNTQLSTEEVISDFCLMEIPALHDNRPQDQGIIPVDAMKIIFKYMNEKDGSLKTFRNQVFVSKLWRTLAIESITTLDIINLMEKSPHRKCALLANIIGNYPLHRFPNLESLSLSFEGIIENELYIRLTHEAERDLSNPKAKLVGQQLDEYETKSKDNKKKLEDIKNIEGGTLKKVFLASGPLIKAVYYENIISGTTKTPTKAEEKRKKIESLYSPLQKEIIQSLCDFNALKKLSLYPLDGTNAFFIEKMPNLKEIRFLSTTTPIYDITGCLIKAPEIFLDALGNMQTNHDLENLYLEGPVHLSSFEGWSKFHKLKELTLTLEFCELRGTNSFKIDNPYRINTILESFPKNFPSLETLTIQNSHIQGLDFWKHLSKLPNLSSLDISSCSLNGNDLSEIIKIASLEILYLNQMDRPQSNRAAVFMMGFGMRYGEEDLENFEKNRPDVEIYFKG